MEEIIETLLRRLEEKDAINASLQNTISSLQGTIDTMASTIEELNKTVAELKEQLNKNSKNSSKPPSSDGYKKPNPKSLREKTGKKQGGQNGHGGSHLITTVEPDNIEQHKPSACEGCQHYDKCKDKACVTETRTVIDAVVDVDITAHQQLTIKCPMSGDILKGEFPEDVKGPIQYGENLQSIVVALNTIGAMGINRIHTILGNIFNIPLSTGVIYNMVERCADSVTDTVESIRQMAIDSDLENFDETGTRVDKKTMWVHAACNREFTYLYLSRKRGTEAMDEGGILPRFKGIAVHDCWRPYWKYEGILHAICNAHILRELKGVIENHPEQVWAAKLEKLLKKMFQAKEKAIAADKQQLSYSQLHRFDKEYDSIIAIALNENPLSEAPQGKSGRKKKGKVLALIERLRDYKESVCLFIHDFKVPFTNNQAEQDIRIMKIKTKVSGCFRTETGAKNYLKIMSYVGTAKKQGINPFEAIKQAVTDNIQLALG